MNDHGIALASYIGVGLCAIAVLGLKAVEWLNYQVRKA